MAPEYPWAEVVNINTSVDSASGLPLIMDEALQSTLSCRFRNYEESLVHFARAIYLLRLEEGRCRGMTGTSPRGFMDPHRLYPVPLADQRVVTASSVTTLRLEQSTCCSHSPI